MNKLFLDDQLLAGDSVAMPLRSRGFAFGYGVFETMGFLQGKPCFFREHLERLRRAAIGAGLKVELDEGLLRERAVRLFTVEKVESGVFKIVISDTGGTPRVAMFVRSAGPRTEPGPCRLGSSPVVKASQAFTSRHKSLNYMESLLECEKARAAGFEDCVFRNERGEVTECSFANLFFFRGGSLRTPALDCGLLDGIVRAKIIDLAREAGLPVEEGAYSEADLLAADEVFLTSSGMGPRPVGVFCSATGEVAEYASALLPDLRKAFMDLELKEANSHV